MRGMDQPPGEEFKLPSGKCFLGCLMLFLLPFIYFEVVGHLGLKLVPFSIAWGSLRPGPVIAKSADELPRTEVVGTLDAPLAPGRNKIGRASCRERV